MIAKLERAVPGPATLIDGPAVFMTDFCRICQ